MVGIELGDVLAVLQLLAPYLIIAAVLIVVAVIIATTVRKRPRPQRSAIRGGTFIGLVLALALIANLIALGPMSTLIGLATGSGKVTDETTAEASLLAEQVAAEGIVLLENDGLLPLAGTTQVNLFGWASAHPVYGGAGSGGLNQLYPFVNIIDGLANAGLTANPDLISFYNQYSDERPDMSIQKQSWTLPEPPVSTYPDELIAGAQDYSDVGIVVLGRMAGEGHTDMPTDVTKVAFDSNSTEYADFQPGEHYLQLSQTEQDMIELVTANFDNVVLVLNSANPLELGFVDDHEQIKSVIWAPGPGNVGFNALGQILTGETNPSGRAADTFVYDMKQTPWWNNQVKRSYENMTHLAVEGMNAGKPEMFEPSFINYVEGIYVGYKFYETADAEGLINYDEVVQYPFGHGLSYTEFSQEMSELNVTGDEISFEVTVTNEGESAGKDVVEVYYNPPYTDGGIEKASANLIAVDKTEVLEPGASETIEISFALEDMASYDMSGAGSYVLESGDYVISINANSHEILDEQTHAVSETVRYGEGRSTDQIPPVNLFADVAGDVPYLSRAGGFANHGEAVAEPASLMLPEPYASQYHTNATFDPTTYINDADQMPTTGADNGMELAELRGADYDDPRWDTLLDQLTVDDMVGLTSLAGYQTAAVESVGKLRTVDSDGPAGINNNFTGQGSIGFPVAVAVANTWNIELVTQYGAMMGKMSRELGSAGWYAPAMNTHRVALGARNYEYFSEDGVLSGLISSAAVQGAESEGVYSYIKHFALYDSNGKMVSIWSNEQAMREIYLKPFEISVKQGGADAVMVAWNYLGAKWVGEWSQLHNTVLRDEWGFRGLVITDFFRNNGHGFMTADMALANGVDGMLSTFEGGPNRPADPESASSVKYMRQASKNFMYTVVNSWVYDEQYAAPAVAPWQWALIGIDVALLGALAAAGLLVRNRYRKHHTDEVESITV